MADLIEIDELSSWHNQCEEELRLSSSLLRRLGPPFVFTRKPNVGCQIENTVITRILSNRSTGEEGISRRDSIPRSMASWAVVLEDSLLSSVSEVQVHSVDLNLTEDFCRNWQVPHMKQIHQSVPQFQQLSASMLSLVKSVLTSLRQYLILDTTRNNGEHDSFPDMQSSHHNDKALLQSTLPPPPHPPYILGATRPTSPKHPLSASQPSSTNDTSFSAISPYPPDPTIPTESGYRTSKLTDDAKTTVVSPSRSQSSLLAIVISLVVAIFWF